MCRKKFMEFMALTINNYSFDLIFPIAHMNALKKDSDIFHNNYFVFYAYNNIQYLFKSINVPNEVFV